jgi:hypothetical protein
MIKFHVVCLYCTFKHIGLLNILDFCQTFLYVITSVQNTEMMKMSQVSKVTILYKNIHRQAGTGVAYTFLLVCSSMQVKVKITSMRIPGKTKVRGRKTPRLQKLDRRCRQVMRHGQASFTAQSVAGGGGGREQPSDVAEKS